MDSSVQVALIGMGGIFLTGISVIVVAVLNSKKERGDTADSAVEKTLRERLALRDEQIADHVEDKAELKERLAECKETVASQGLLVAQQVETIAEHVKNMEGP